MAKTYADLTVANATAGNAILASDFTTLFTNSNNYRVPPSCRVRPTSNRAFSAGGFITFDTDSGEGCHDTDTMWSAGDPTKVVIQTPGIYLCTATAYFSGAAGTANVGQIILTANIGGTDYQVSFNTAAGVNSGSGALATCSTSIALSTSDYLRVQTYNNGTGTPNILAVGTNLSASWIGQVS